MIKRDIKQLEALYTQTQDPATLAEIRVKINAYHDFVDDEVKYKSRRYVARNYGEGGRPGRALSSKIKPGHTMSYITQITHDQNNMLYDTPSIMDYFATYYTNIYSKKTNTTPAEVNHYLQDTAIAWLSNADREFLCHHITKDEMIDAIKSLPNNKAPGTDGLPGEFYKEYKELLIPHIAEMFEEAYEKGELPPSLREALLVTLPKPEKDLTKCKSYRPLSLINIDVKILAKIIATRIQLLQNCSYYLTKQDLYQIDLLPKIYELYLPCTTSWIPNNRQQQPYWMRQKPLIL